MKTYHWKIDGQEACQSSKTLRGPDGKAVQPATVCAFTDIAEFERLKKQLSDLWPDAVIEMVEGPCNASAREDYEFYAHSNDLEEERQAAMREIIMALCSPILMMSPKRTEVLEAASKYNITAEELLLFTRRKAQQT